MTVRLIDKATIETTSWEFLTNPHDEYEAWRRGMVEELWNDGEKLDWGINPDTQAALRRQTDHVAKRFEVSAEDLHGDTILHLAVLPERANADSQDLLNHRAYQVAANLAKPAAKIADRERSLEALLDDKFEEME